MSTLQLRRTALIVAVSLGWLVLALAGSCASVSSPGGGGDVLFHNGAIYTGKSDGGPHAALLARAGRVVAVGALADVEALAQGTLRHVDLGGGVALPGLQDAHGHVEGLGADLEWVDLRGAETYDEIIRRTAARATELSGGEWVLGRGWDQNLWPEKAFPHHRALSAAVPDHPVFLKRVDGHATLVNAAAMERAGLVGGGDPIPGGRVHVDADGRPTGVLIDAAQGLVAAYLPEPTREDRLRYLRNAQEALLAVGLTCVHDMGVDPTAVELYRELREGGELDLRIVAYLSASGIDGPRALDGFPIQPDAEDRFTLIGAKLYADGALGSRGAALLADYADAPGESGLMILTPGELRERVRWLAGRGMQPATHAIGDRANRVVLDTYADVMRDVPGLRALRPRVEHAQVVDAADWTRFEELGVLPSMQPTHCTSDMPWVPDRIGRERSRGAYAWRRLMGDQPLPLGSDFPVEDPSPLEGLYAATTRTDRRGRPRGGFFADQRLTIQEAIAGFTIDAAYAAHQEDRRGFLRAGFYCDMTVVDTDPYTVPPEELLRTSVLMTIVNGEVVHTAGR